MVDTAEIIQKVRAGFKTLDVSVKHQIEALIWLEMWLTDDIFLRLRASNQIFD